MRQGAGRTQWSRRELLKLGAAAVVAAQGPVMAKRVRTPERLRRTSAPHILFLMADQFRADCLGAAGNRAIHTPNLDHIAREGVLFRSGYSCTPTCTPARSALLTGLGPWRNGMLGYGRVAERYPIEKPRALAEAGYYTFGIGKMHWHPQRNKHGFHQVLLDESGRAELPDFRSDYRCWFASEAPTLDPDVTSIGWNDYRGKTYQLPEELHPTSWTGRTAVRFLRSYDQPQPFFLKVSFARPHSPYDPPKRFMRRYAGKSLAKAVVGAWAQRYAPRSDDSFSIWHGDLGADQVRQSRQAYYGSVTFVDDQVGRILDALGKRGWLDETLILFTADHGDMLGDHHLWRKSYPYESSARIPFLMRWPTGLVSAKRGQVLEPTVELRDVLPTLLHAASGSIPEGFDGRSLLPVVEGKTSDWRAYIDLEHDICYNPSNHWNALTDGHWKYVFHARDGDQQLFNLDSDPHELKDLASDAAHQDQLRLWRGRLIAHLSERGEEWVKNGDLALRPKGHLYSPNYPGCSCHPQNIATSGKT